MTGDSSRRKQALSVFLSTLMVLSVLAMGMAGFAGSAAAASQSDTDSLADGEGYIVADPANANEDAVHTIQLQVDDTFSGANLNETNVSYAGLDPTDPGGASVGVWVNNNKVDSGEETVDITSDSVNITNLNAGTTAGLSEGDVITIEIDSINNTDGSDVGVTVNGPDQGSTNSLEFSGLTLSVGEGPIKVSQGSDTFYWNTFYRGVKNASSSGHTVTVTEDLDETLPTAATATVQSSGVTIQGQSSPTINVSGLSANVIDLSGQTNLTVDGLTIEGDGLGSSAVTGTTTNTTISANTFQNVTGTTVSLDTSDGNADTLEISNNTFTGEQGKTIEVNPSTYADEGDTVTIDSNNITRDSSGQAAIDIDTGGGVGQVDITGGTIEGDTGSDDTGISTNNENVTIDGVTINATKTGIDAAQTGETLTISGTTITNLAASAGSLVAIDADDTNSVTAITVNESTSIDQADTGISVDLDNNDGSTADINNVDVNGTTTGVDVASVDSGGDAVNITDSTFTQNTDGVKFSDADNDGGTALYNVHFNTFESNTDGVEVSADKDDSAVYNATFNDFVSNDEKGLHVSTTQSSSQVNASYNWWGATNGPSGQFNGNGSTITASDGEVSIDPATVKKDDGNVSLEQDFLGVVKDSQNVTLNGSSSDATYSFSTNDSDTVPGANNSAEVDGTLVLGLNGTDYVFKDALNEGEVNTSVSGAEADSGKNGTSIANTTPTGDTPITVVGNNSTTAVSDTGTIRLVHEVQNIGEDYTLTSLPQPAEVYTTDVTDFTSWSNANSNYNDSALSTDGSLVTNSEAIHKGQYAYGDSSDARIGYDFVTPGESDVQLGAGGFEELNEGFHLVGSNYNINGSYTEDVNQDLSTVCSLPENAGDYQGNESFVVYEPVSFGEVGGSSTVDNYEGYWVYVDVGEDPETRTIKLARYDPAAS